MNLINDTMFYVKNETPYPPFKDGLYIEEYFFEFMKTNEISLKRKYIPAFWTNLQAKKKYHHDLMKHQKSLDEWFENNPSEGGYFTLCQHADGIRFNLRNRDVLIFGGSEGNDILPLIYEDKRNTLLSLPRKSWKEKKHLCSFVGAQTHNGWGKNVRKIIVDKYSENKNFQIINHLEWKENVCKQKQDDFIEITSNSKFCLSPRGYGRSSFRFFESLQMGVIPIYIWDDIEWLPYKDDINYDKFSISINFSELDSLENTLLNIDEETYNSMLSEYEKVKHYFTLEGMTNYIIKKIGY